MWLLRLWLQLCCHTMGWHSLAAAGAWLLVCELQAVCTAKASNDHRHGHLHRPCCLTKLSSAASIEKPACVCTVELHKSGLRKAVLSGLQCV